MARDGHLDIIGYDRAAGVCQTRQHLAGNTDGIGAFALGNRQGDRRMDTLGGRLGGKALFSGGRAGAEKHILTGLLGSVHNRRHVPQVNRFAVVGADHDVFHIFDGLKEPPGVNDDLPLARWIAAGIGSLVGHGNLVEHFYGIQTETLQALSACRYPCLVST
jgi:hypothetical protein